MRESRSASSRPSGRSAVRIAGDDHSAFSNHANGKCIAGVIGAASADARPPRCWPCARRSAARWRPAATSTFVVLFEWREVERDFIVARPFMRAGFITFQLAGRGTSVIRWGSFLPEMMNAAAHGRGLRLPLILQDARTATLLAMRSELRRDCSVHLVERSRVSCAAWHRARGQRRHSAPTRSPSAVQRGWRACGAGSVERRGSGFMPPPVPWPWHRAADPPRWRRRRADARGAVGRALCTNPSKSRGS